MDNDQKSNSTTVSSTPAAPPAPTAGSKPTPVTQAKSNAKAVLDAWHDKCREFGAAEGRGGAMKMAWWDDLAERAHQHRDDKMLTPDDIAAGYAIYHEARTAANPALRASRVKDGATGSDAAQRIAEAKRLVSVIQLPQLKGLTLYKQACRVVRDSKDAAGSTDQLVYKLMVAQFGQPALPMSVDDMKHHLTASGKTKASRTRADWWAMVRSQIESTAKNHGGHTPHTRAAYQSIASQIEEWGGTTKEKERRAKLDAKKNRPKK